MEGDAVVIPQNNQPKFLTKNELRAAAMCELKVSRNSFDFAWIDAIERTGRHDWRNPLDDVVGLRVKRLRGQGIPVHR
jgi:hypothetical protein